ncbi:MAG TPA: hypothetical protein PKE31_03950 [Pseudomonadota bacterium]|nr:hypothetical protein [Pseudomonadota bacterium]
MTLTLRAFLCCALLSAPLSVVRADGPAETPNYDEPETNPIDDGQTGQVYQPPPEGICFDDENQMYDCSKDEDFQSYSNLDDGYDPSAFDDFRDALSPYGQWVQTPQYGQVWVPSSDAVGQDFTPYYTGGRWNYTDYGWTWVSEYNWGWAPFHYGRWLVLPGFGWSWVPGRIWGPAWVHWRTGGGYVGWTPLPPRGMVIPRPVMGARFLPWVFVAAHEILAPRPIRIGLHLLPNLFLRTTIANDYRSIGTNRVIVGPPLHHFPGVRVVPAPLGSIQISLPRSHVVVRPGVPLFQRSYYSPYNRPGAFQGPPNRPGFPLPYQRPGFPPPYQRPGFPPPYQRPGFPPPYQRPGFPPAGQNPGFPSPHQRPGFPPPSQRPGFPTEPTQRPPVFQPGPQPPLHRPPIFQRPGHDEHPHPNMPPQQQPQVPEHRPPSYPRPTFEPRPVPPPVQRPTFEPRPVPPPVQRPTFEPRPVPPPVQRPTFEPRPVPPPVHRPPVFQPPMHSPATRVVQPPPPTGQPAFRRR